MTGADRRPEAEAEYGSHLQRSETVWNRWSDWYGMSERDFEPLRNAVIARLGLEPGDRVLDIGCGPGVNFAVIRDAIGESGSLVGIDYSPEMVAQAEERIQDNGWENVTVVRADATTADLNGSYDGAVATLALSVMPDIERAVRNVHATLRSGAHLGVLDIDVFQDGALRIVNPVLWRFLRWYANWNPDESVRRVIDAVFNDVQPLDTHMRGILYTVLATR